MIELYPSRRWEQQPCMFGTYGIVLFWSEEDFEEVNEQLYAQIVGWA